MLSRNYKEEDRRISTGVKLHDYESRLVRRAYHLGYWILGVVVIGGAVYVMFAAQAGWWLPATTHQTGWIVFVLASLWYAMPTLIMAWIYKNDWDRPWPAFEDENE